MPGLEEGPMNEKNSLKRIGNLNVFYLSFQPRQGKEVTKTQYFTDCESIWEKVKQALLRRENNDLNFWRSMTMQS